MFKSYFLLNNSVENLYFRKYCRKLTTVRSSVENYTLPTVLIELKIMTKDMGNASTTPYH